MSNAISNQYTNVSDAKNTISLKASLTATISKEKPGMYVSYCPALNLCSQGETSKEAEKNIIEATELFIEDCLERNVLDEVLKNRGFHPTHQKSRRRKIKKEPAAADAMVRQISIPTELPMLAYG
ncbi:type II toxin-antitoxin system HicB family antitoxin [Candidatus Spongiihabitans sp.]|uniref:type II toxin-antitoxin system HicB family antitoxin n=1 Tax=Candidatus Spongiihabitans sp. TaxID=3101308 RepID=UPI003C6F6D05